MVMRRVRVVKKRVVLVRRVHVVARMVHVLRQGLLFDMREGPHHLGGLLLKLPRCDFLPSRARRDSTKARLP